MADIVLPIVVEKLTNLIMKEAVFLKGVSEKVELMRDDFQWMQTFLRNADAEQEKNDMFHTWVSQIREVALDAEDVIETYIYKASQSSWNFAEKSINLHKAGTRIDKIQSRLGNIKSQKEHFIGITGSSAGQEEHERRKNKLAAEKLRWWRQTSPSIEEDDLVDLVEDTDELIAQLSSMEARRRVVSIVGMGGLGKTTLAKKLYNHREIERQFDLKAFVYISKQYSRRDTLQGIIAAISPNCNIQDLKKIQEEDLVSQLRRLLKERRYLVVLDDMWEKEVWDSMEAAFPSGKMGSKVLLTTRKREVALHADPGSIPHEPRMLTEDESLELFRKKALPEKDHIPFDLEKLAREMVGKCGGLPLAVVVLGGLLSSKMKTLEEWRRVLQNISLRLIGEDRVSTILVLSYNDLPFHLKSCFLHLGMFPEDYFIRKKKLMHFWAAEGFLPQEKGEETAEDVAENCVNELINRCMIQVGRLTSFGRVKTIRIHDLLRDLSVSKGNEESFLRIYSGRKVESTSNPSPKSRRLAIHGDCDRYDFLKPYAPHLRSLQLFNVQYPKRVDRYCKNMKLLRVIDGVRAPTAIGSLTQLRYLDLRRHFFEDKIPRSLGNLKHLQTLNLSSYKNESSISNVIWKLKDLKHLYLSHGVGGNLRLDTLSKLETLQYIGAGKWIEDGGLASMISLRKLKIGELSRENVSSVISIIAEKLHHLESLSLFLINGESFSTSMRFADCEHLHKLHLTGKIEKLSDPHEFPPNLVKLSLYQTYLRQDSVDILARLPNLKMLILRGGSIRLTELVFSSEGFPQLHNLQLEHQPDLEALAVGNRAIMKLQNVKVVDCPRLKKIPARIILRARHVWGWPKGNDEDEDS